MDNESIDMLLPIHLSRLHNLLEERKVLLQPPVFQFTSINHSTLLTETTRSFRDWNMEAQQCLQFYERATEIIKGFDQQWERATEELISLRKRSHYEKTEILQAMFASIQNEVILHDERVAHFNGVLLETPDLQENIQNEIDELDTIYEFYITDLQKRMAYAKEITNEDKFRSFVVKEIDLNLDWLDHVHNYMIPHFNIYLGEPVETWPQERHAAEPKKRSTTARSNEEVVTDLKKSMRDVHHDICNALQVGSSVIIEVEQLKRKITELQNRSELLAQHGSSAVGAMQHKVAQLQQRLAELIELERVVASIDQKWDVKYANLDDDDARRVFVFDHKLTAQGKATLMQNLEKHWEEIIHHNANMFKSIQVVQLEKQKTSIISIMSTPGFTTDTYSDAHGTFYIDEYGRKLYTVQGEETPYQINELGELVLLKDDSQHKYYYDEIGRYYLEGGTERVYKRDAGSSEYMLGANGQLERVREWRDGVEYAYDELGRFRYYSDTGKKVYQESDGASEYVADEFGNLVRETREHSAPDVEPCSRSDGMSAEGEWLRATVGRSLARGLAQMVLMRPTNPMQYLTEWIFHDLRNVENRQKRQEERQKLKAKREEMALHMMEVISCRCSSGSVEYSGVDENMIDYHPNSAVGNTVDGSVEDILDTLDK